MPLRPPTPYSKIDALHSYMQLDPVCGGGEVRGQVWITNQKIWVWIGTKYLAGTGNQE